MIERGSPNRPHRTAIPPYAKVAVSAWISRAVTIVVSLATIRILIDSLGLDIYAAYALLTGAASWLLLADGGVSQSLQNYISERRVHGQDYAEHMLAAVGVLALFASVTIGVLYFSKEAIGSVLLSNFPQLPRGQKATNFIAVGALTVGVGMGSAVYKIWYAEQRGHLANLFSAMASLLGLLGLFVIARSSVENKLLWALIAINLPLAGLPLLALGWQTRASLRRGFSVGWPVLRGLLTRGFRFWIFNVMAAAVLQLDYLVLSQFVDAEEVVAYTITAKLFLLASFMYSAVLQAFWPQCAEWFAANDLQAIRVFIRRYLVISTGFMVCFTTFVILGIEPILKLFTVGETLTIPLGFLALTGLTYTVRSYTDLFAVILQSISDLNPLLKWATVQASLNIAGQLLLAPLWGIYGVTGGILLSFILTVTWALPRSVHRHLRIQQESGNERA